MTQPINKNFSLKLAAAALLLSSVSATAGEGRLLRFPSTNGHEVAFTYAGDLYTVPITGGTAQRLTSHEGYEIFSRFSPDGRTIAFTGQYDGNTEVYVIPSVGGEPRRVTYTASNPRDDVGDRMGPNNIVVAWTPDGKQIVYRNRVSDSFDGMLCTVPVEGGLSTRLPLSEGGFACYNADGSKLAFNRVFREFRTWKYYRGGMADDIWVLDTRTQQVSNITNNIAQDISPMWIGDEIYFMSDRDMRMNIFVYNTVTGTTSKVTDFTDFDVKFASCGGGAIVFENGGYIYHLDPATKQYNKVRVELNSENIDARPAIRQVKDFVRSMGLSPDAHRMAVSARGEVFDVPVKEGVTRNITRTAGVHERNAQWSPDGRNIAYISDQTGETELWMRPAEGGDAVQLTHGGDCYINNFTWSPDGSQIVYTDSRNRLMLVSVAGRSATELERDSMFGFSTPEFSPDGKWLTYDKTETNQFRTVYLYNLASRKAYQVTDRWYDSNSPAFSADGKYLIFASGRDFNPIYSSIEWNFAYSKMEGIYLALLAADTPSPFLPTDDRVNSDKQQPDATAQDKKGKEAKKSSTTPSTRVDIEGIGDRIVKVPVSASNYGGFACDGERLWYNGNGGCHVYNLKEQKDETIVAGADIELSHDMKKALISKGKSAYVVDAPRGKVELGKAVNLDEMTTLVDYNQEWRQIYDEAWRVYRDGFYLENMHGVDWQAVHDKYAQLLPYVKNRLDLTYVIGGMISELAVGHSYVDGGDHRQYKQHHIGMLGADIVREGKGFKIKKIYRGAPERSELRSPLCEPGMNINEGDVITAVDGVSTDTVADIYTLLQDKAGVLTELTIGGRKVVVKPIRSEYDLRHYAWVQDNIKHVEERTGGRVGYIYIPDMGPEGLKEFSRYFFAQTDKEAVIIDDRGNGGGNISPMVIERLLRKPYRMTMYRGSSYNGTIPDQTIVGPKVLLINKYSASDGDLFPWSFKENKIGTVIGTRTWGGIVGISSSKPYMDGTDIRTPFFTNYDMRGNWIVENHGVDPDILVDNDPVQEFNGVDQQLDRAIDVILEQLKDRQPLPKTPAPRTMRDLGL